VRTGKWGRETREAVKIYNELANRVPVGRLFESTCCAPDCPMTTNSGREKAFTRPLIITTTYGAAEGVVRLLAWGAAR
jgi:hypothetical protein